ncbi:uncharacterized protein LY89DRAFT_592238 [Mollisia scopiformis]|uniref:Uncharacterized protein n=1 Tax=Mollisia scopiformis TaxID=149040 RepID=A0A194WZJ3_MOLSC|nr:uncharacterized protein LY89DRAFT_592238 [Mollisia scopiformis]KUJ13027.1 hypothetical protein LY89DRAFT_592238 [Mollisia scopiformis]
MAMSRVLPVTLGALAVSSELAMLTFDVIFAVTLSRSSSPVNTNVVAIVASVLSSIAALLLLLLLGRQIRYRNGAHIQDFGHGRQHTYLLAGFGGVFGLLSAVASAVLLGMMRTRIADLPKRTIHSSTESMVTGAFIVWAITLISQAMFIICMVIVQRRDFQQQIQPYRADTEEPEQFPDMVESRPRASSVQRSEHRATPSVDSKSPPPSSGRSRAGSDTMSSFRSSLSQVVRPINSKTKLIQPNHRSPYRPQSTRSIDSSHRDTSISIEDGFDSWDTSAVDPQSREAVASVSPTPQRFLETIPASPTGSRSPSPGFPLDLEPPKSRKRSRSYSPANSYRDLPRTARTTSPTESVNAEAHIHPLFRTDSPTPPPAATPGTIVTAAPGAGQVISDRQSIRSIHRMRSGSLPSSPLVHSNSLDSIRRAMEREELERLEEVGGERSLTPPIPDFILNGGPRNSMQGYNSRKKTQAGLGKLGEVRDE